MKLMSQLYTLNPRDSLSVYIIYISFCGTQFKILQCLREIYKFNFFFFLLFYSLRVDHSYLSDILD